MTAAAWRLTEPGEGESSRLPRRACALLGAAPGSLTLFLPLLRVAQGRMTYVLGIPRDKEGEVQRAKENLTTAAPSKPEAAAHLGLCQSLLGQHVFSRSRWKKGGQLPRPHPTPLSVSAGGKTIFS